VLLSACRPDAPPRLVDVYSLSPLGVLPDQQGQGIGVTLIEHALAAADRQSVPLVFLEGSPPYCALDCVGLREPQLSEWGGAASPRL
jgi:putative acetyltransferase